MSQVVIAIGGVLANLVLYKHCDNNIVDIKNKKKNLLSTITNKIYESNNNKEFILEIQTGQNLGIVDLYKQNQEVKYDYIPYVQYNFDALFDTRQSFCNQGLMQTARNELVFKNKNKFLTDTGFGTGNILFPSSKFNMGSINIKLPQYKSTEIGEGSVIESKLNSIYGVSTVLKRDHIYKYNYIPYDNKKVFLIGKQINSRFMYDNFNTDPNNLVNNKYDDRIELNEFGKFASVLGAIAFIVFGSFK